VLLFLFFEWSIGADCPPLEKGARDVLVRDMSLVLFAVDFSIYYNFNADLVFRLADQAQEIVERVEAVLE